MVKEREARRENRREKGVEGDREGEKKSSNTELKGINVNTLMWFGKRFSKQPNGDGFQTDFVCKPA